MSHGILIIEDEVVLAKKIAKYLTQNGYEVRVAGNGYDGLKVLETFLPDVVLLDFNLPGGFNGIEVLKRICSYDSGIKVILITGQGNIQLAVDAMKSGAYDYLSKPIMLSGLKVLLERLIGQDQKENLLSYYHQKQAALLDIKQIIGHCAAINRVRDQIRRIVNAGNRLTNGAPQPVLITGETGTGKELIARAIHFGGDRSKGPFVELKAATTPAHLVGFELFGYERGAVQNARERKMGLVESANGGTLFLDEIGELAPEVQDKLTKLLEDYEVHRFGSVGGCKVDIQIISATNRQLTNMVEEARFSASLLSRLNKLTVEVPPLRDRGEDILILARYFVRLFVRKYDKPCLELDESAVSEILGYYWPGNVRELRNKMEQAVLLCDQQEISAEYLAIPKNVNIPERSSCLPSHSTSVGPSQLTGRSLKPS